MTVLDTSRKHWDTTPDRLIHTTRHRVAPTPGTGARVDAAQRVQSSVYDVVAEHLVHHPCKLWMATGKSRSDSVLKWLTRERKTRPDWQSETVAVVRGAARDAFEATRRWDEHQHELARSVLREQDAEDAIRNGKAPHPNEIQDDEERRKHEPSPRLVRRWTKEPCTTGRREERTAALRLLEPPKVVDATTVRLPGIGDLELQDPVPDGADVRSCQVVESTREGTPPDKKRYRVHLQIGTPVPKTRRRRAVGIDLGVVHAITTSDGEFLDRPDVSALLEEARALGGPCAQALHTRLAGLETAPCASTGAAAQGASGPGQLGVACRQEGRVPGRAFSAWRASSSGTCWRRDAGPRVPRARAPSTA